MNANILRVALGAALASVALAGCQREAGGPTMGQKLDSAIEHTQELGGRAEVALTTAASLHRMRPQPRRCARRREEERRGWSGRAGRPAASRPARR